MKCNELQIGDWVIVKPSLLPVCVAAVHQKKIGYHIYQHRLEWVRQSLLEPIPLTDEFLKKHFELVEGRKEEGYQLCSLWRIWSNSNYGYIAATLTIDRFGGGGYEPCIPCRYVHELQNLLRQLKIDKEITL